LSGVGLVVAWWVVLRYLGELTRVDRALELLLSVSGRVGESFRVPVWEGVGLVVASGVRAPHGWPPRHRSAYDGYAVRSSDTPGRLRLVGEAPIGSSRVGLSVGPGEAVYVTTGAFLPEGADAVVAEEKVRVEDGTVVIPVRVDRYKNIDPAGSIVREGQLLVEAGTVLSPADVVGLLEVGVTEVEVYRRVRIAVVSTGSELILPGDPEWTARQVLEGKVVATTGGLVSWFLQSYAPWVEIVDEAVLPDNREAVAWYVKRLLPLADVVLLTGGTGPSHIDLFYQLKDEIGGEIVFRGLYVKGGRPTSAYVVDGKPVIGLSGYPLSAFHALVRLVLPFLREIGGVRRGAPPLPLVDAVLDEPIGRGRPRPVKVRVARRGDGLHATPLAGRYQLSSANVGLVYSDGIAFVDDREYRPGDKVQVLLLRDPRGPLFDWLPGEY